MDEHEKLHQSLTGLNDGQAQINEGQAQINADKSREIELLIEGQSRLSEAVEQLIDRVLALEERLR